jgi:hypothetical protein
MARFTHPANDGSGVSAVLPFHGSFSSTTTQQASVASVPQAVIFENTLLSQGVTIQQDENEYFTKITFENPGVYDIKFSGQIHHRGGGGTGELFTMWFRQNGIDIPNSRTLWHVANGLFLVPTLNLFVTIENPNEYVQLVGYPTNTQIVLEYLTAGTDGPGSPSMILTVNQIA